MVQHFSWPHPLPPTRLWVVAGLVLLTTCSAPDKPRAPYVPLADLQTVFGPLVTAGNHPTADQAGTGDRLGFFRDESGTVWGLPLSVQPDGSVIGCAPSTLHDAPVTDTYPLGFTIIGATNEPTGWRGGTGKLEILLRDAQGRIRWLSVNGSHLDTGPVCWAQEPPGPKQRLQYYRLAPSAASRRVMFRQRRTEVKSRPISRRHTIGAKLT